MLGAYVASVGNFSMDSRSALKGDISYRAAPSEIIRLVNPQFRSESGVFKIAR